jgi:hypothetical protein
MPAPGRFSTMDSPYLSLFSLVKGWPQENVRREVLMVTAGIDRLRGQLSPWPAWATTSARSASAVLLIPDLRNPYLL